MRRLSLWRVTRELVARYATPRLLIGIFVISTGAGAAVWTIGEFFGTAAGLGVATFTILAGLSIPLATSVSWLGRRHRQMEARLVLAEEIGEIGFWYGATLYSAQPDMLLVVSRLIRERRPGVVVELGAGVSTILIAVQLRQLGSGRLVSVENDARYAETVRQRLDELGLTDWVTVVVADLVPYAGPGGAKVWYDMARVRDVVTRVDMLLVDGPSVAFGEMVREPALDAFAPLLTPGAVVLLDDAKRPGELRIVRNWRRRHTHARFTLLDTEHGAQLVEWSGQSAGAAAAHAGA